MHNSWRSYRNMLLKSRNYKECTEGCCRYVTLSRMCGIVRSGKGRGGRRRRRSWWEWREGVGEDRKTRGGEGAKHFYKSLQFQLFVSISTLLRSLYCHTFLASCRKAHPNIVLPTPTQNRPWNFSFAWFSLKWFNRGRNVKYSYEKSQETDVTLVCMCWRCWKEWKPLFWIHAIQQQGRMLYLQNMKCNGRVWYAFVLRGMKTAKFMPIWQPKCRDRLQFQKCRPWCKFWVAIHCIQQRPLYRVPKQDSFIAQNACIHFYVPWQLPCAGTR